MDIHLPDWKEILDTLVRFPVLMVMLLGQLFGSVFTQAVKKTWLAFGISRVPKPRYQVTVWWLAILATYLFTLLLWRSFLGTQGIQEVVCIGAAFCSPPLYNAIKRWSASTKRFAWIAESLGDNGHYPEPPDGH